MSSNQKLKKSQGQTWSPSTSLEKEDASSSEDEGFRRQAGRKQQEQSQKTKRKASFSEEDSSSDNNSQSSDDEYQNLSKVTATDRKQLTHPPELLHESINMTPEGNAINIIFKSAKIALEFMELAGKDVCFMTRNPNRKNSVYVKKEKAEFLLERLDRDSSLKKYQSLAGRLKYVIDTKIKKITPLSMLNQKRNPAETERLNNHGFSVTAPSYGSLPPQPLSRPLALDTSYRQGFKKMVESVAMTNDDLSINIRFAEEQEHICKSLLFFGGSLCFEKKGRVNSVYVKKENAEAFLKKLKQNATQYSELIEKIELLVKGIKQQSAVAILVPNSAPPLGTFSSTRFFLQSSVADSTHQDTHTQPENRGNLSPHFPVSRKTNTCLTYSSSSFFMSAGGMALGGAGIGYGLFVLSTPIGQGLVIVGALLLLAAFIKMIRDCYIQCLSEKNALKYSNSVH